MNLILTYKKPFATLNGETDNDSTFQEIHFHFY